MGRPSRYTEEFKGQAFDLVLTTDRTHADVAVLWRTMLH